MTRPTRYRNPGSWHTSRWAGRCASASCRGDGQIFTGEPIWCTRPPARTHCSRCGTHLQAIQRQAEATETETKISATAFNKATKEKGDE